MLPAECHSQPAAMLEQQMDLVGSEFQSVLDVLKFSTAEDHMKDDRDGKAQRTE